MVNRFLLKYNKRHEHAAFSTWYKKIQDRINARKYFKKMISRYERKEEASCLMMWKASCPIFKENERLLKSAQEKGEIANTSRERSCDATAETKTLHTPCETTRRVVRIEDMETKCY